MACDEVIGSYLHQRLHHRLVAELADQVRRQDNAGADGDGNAQPAPEDILDEQFTALWLDKSSQGDSIVPGTLGVLPA